LTYFSVLSIDTKYIKLSIVLPVITLNMDILVKLVDGFLNKYEKRLMRGNVAHEKATNRLNINPEKHRSQIVNWQLNMFTFINVYVNIDSLGALELDRFKIVPFHSK